MLRTTFTRSAIAVLGACWLLAPTVAKPTPPELPAETLTTRSLAGVSSDRIYVADVAINHIPDGRIRVFAASTGKLLGMINSGYVGNFALSRQGDELYNATTYLSRGGRGERTDILEVWDTTQLDVKYEVILPPHRAQALTYRGLVHTSANSRFVMVQNATPATSVTVVDLKERKVAGEIPTPGCWGIWPSASHAARFSMLCGDGKIATITLNEVGQVAERQLSDKLFDADQDPWFHHAEQVGDRAWFLSFQGQLTEVDLSGATARASAQHPLVDKAAAKAGWRPGGYQVFSVDPTAQQAVVAMHDQGTEGSHKRPAKQLWVVDLNTAKRVATFPGKGLASLTFSRNGQRLQGLDGETGAMHVWQWTGGAKPTLKPLSTVKKAGDSSLQLETQD